MKKPQIKVQAYITQATKDEITELAKKEKRSISSMAGKLLDTAILMKEAEK